MTSKSFLLYSSASISSQTVKQFSQRGIEQAYSSDRSHPLTAKFETQGWGQPASCCWVRLWAGRQKHQLTGISHFHLILPTTLFQELGTLREVLRQALELDSTEINLNLHDSWSKTGSQGMSDTRGIKQEGYLTRTHVENQGQLYSRMQKNLRKKIRVSIILLFSHHYY